MRYAVFLITLCLISCSTSNGPEIIIAAEDPLSTENKTAEIALGFVDKNGWKQGLFIDTAAHSIYHRTYVDDTLNGTFLEYSSYGSLITKGAYKNKAKQGEWIEYQLDGTVASISHYDAGLKQGTFQKYYPNGDLKYQGIFNADTMVGNVQNYFKNGNIESEGNRQNGTWTTYYKNKQIESIENFSQSQLVGDVQKFDSSGVQILPVFIPQTEADTCVLNATDLDVKIMYETDRSNRVIMFGEYLFGGAKVGTYHKALIIKFGWVIFTLKPDGVKMQQNRDIQCEREISTTQYGINRVTKELPDGEWDIFYVNEKVKHKTSFGTLTVDVQDLSCDDTGTNPITLNHQGETLAINHIGNLQFFEYDVDKNGSKELYILNYASCQGYLKIYKVTKRS